MEVNRLLIGGFCAGTAIALLLLAIWWSTKGLISGVWLALLMGLILFLVGMLTLRRNTKL